MKSKLRIVLFCILCSLNVFSQEKEKEDHKYFAFGVRANTFTQTEFQNFNLPPAKLTLNIDPIKYMRIDFQYGTGKSQYEQTVSSFPSGSSTYTMNDKTNVFAVGLFAMYRIEKTNFYLGTRFGKIKYTSDAIDYSSTYPRKVTDKGETGTLNGVLGGEYFFANRFSVGAEFCITRLKDTFSPGATGSPSKNSMYSSTEGSVLFRFYPF
jgi:hypothetical protein